MTFARATSGLGQLSPEGCTRDQDRVAAGVRATHSIASWHGAAGPKTPAALTERRCGARSIELHERKPRRGNAEAKGET